MRLSGVGRNRSLVSDEVWAVIGPLFPAWKGNGRPVADRRLVVEGTAWKFRTGAPWRDLPERFGNWNTVFKNFDRWAKDGTWTRVLEHVQTVPTPSATSTGSRQLTPRSCASTSTARHFPATQGEPSNYMKLGHEPPDHAIGRSRGGLTSKLHMATDGKGRMLSAVLTAGNINDTTMMATTLEQIRVPRPGRGRPRTRPDRLLADKGYTSKANRTWLADRGIKATIPEKSDQAANRKRKGSSGGRPPAFDGEAYKGRNVVERGFNRLKNWRGLAMRSDKTARNFLAAVQLAASLAWLGASFSNTP